MGKFFAELKQRHIYRVGAAYVVVAWSLAQVVGLLSEVYALPAWIGQPAIALLTLGFPIALSVAWIVESKPHQAAISAVRSKPTIVDWTLCGALAAVLIFMGYQQVTRPSDVTRGQASTNTARSVSPDPARTISLAVLPFTNLSGDPEQEFFSDGMTEEITSALARVPDLRVVGRTSAFQFKGHSEDLRTIGQSLNATHLIEGSVRKEGQRLRITAQLIRAEDGTEIWTETYDRQMTGIFTTQEDIARAITASLQMPLGLTTGENLVNNRNIDPDTYADYLRARILVRTRQPQQASNAVSLIEEITSRDAGYAPAWALLALAYDATPQDPAWYSGAGQDMRRVAGDSLPKEEAAVQTALRLDPNLAEGYAARGRLQVRRGELVSAEDSYKAALALDPNNADTLQLYGNLLAELGRLKDALDTMQRLRAVEPFVPILNLNAAMVMWLNGRDEDAISIMETLPSVAARSIDLSQIYATTGRYHEAVDQLVKIPSETFYPGLVDEAIRLLRSAPSTVASTQRTPPLGRLGFVYLYTGAPVRALEFHEASVDAGFAVAITLAELWHPSYAVVRKTDRFKILAGKAGLVSYWKTRGWPDLCHPVGADDFACN